MADFDFLVIGAGIAGASIGHGLSGNAKVGVLEMESQPGYHTTGRSVAVYTTAYGPPIIRKLITASYDFMHNPQTSFCGNPIVHDLGMCFIASEGQEEDFFNLLNAVKELNPAIHEISPAEAERQVPIMRHGYIKAAFSDPSTAGIDVNEIHQGYLRGIKANDGQIICDAGVNALERKGGEWRATTRAGEFSARVIVNAAGAWADEIAALAGTRKIGIVPKRRTVVSFDGPPGVDVNKWPGVIDTHETFYFKPDAGLLVGSPGDETPDNPQDAQPELEDVAITIDRIMKATTLQIERPKHTWAGLRNFVEDRLPAVGYANDVDGFFWYAAQGGYGVANSFALSRSGANLAQGQNLPAFVSDLGVSAADISPERLWAE